MKWARTGAAALFRRVFLINGLIFTLGTLALAVSPATVSSRIKLTEIPVLVVGLAVMLTANAFLLRSSLAPLLKSERTTASATALAAQENERQRIARELHERVGQ
jgi:two-component system, NarL family, sensor histidine kinase UhpB